MNIIEAGAAENRDEMGETPLVRRDHIRTKRYNPNAR